MKKTCIMILASVFFLSGKTSLYAQSSVLAPEDVLETSSELEEVRALQDEMTEWMEGLAGETAEDVTVYYDKALKIYDGSGVIQMKTDDSAAIMDALKQNGHIWVIPAEMNGELFELTVAKGLPLSGEAKQLLTEAQQQEILKNEGKWTITECGDSTEGYRSVYERVEAQENNLKECDRVVLANSLAGFQYPILLGMKDKKAVSFAGIGYGYSAVSDYEDEMQVGRSRTSGNEGVYGFKELTDCAEAYFEPSPELNAGSGAGVQTNGISLLYIGLPVAAVVLLALVIMYQRKSKKFF